MYIYIYMYIYYKLRIFSYGDVLLIKVFMSIPVARNLFRAVAHFVEPPIFAADLFRVPWPTLRASHISVAHFDYVDDGKVVGISVRTHGNGGDLQKKKKGYCLPSSEIGRSAGGIGADLQRKLRSRHLQFMGAGQYGCLYAPVFLNFIRLANPLLK